MTLLMGLYARLPFAAAPGMGMNAFIAYTIILGEKVPWQIALGITFWAGVLFALVFEVPVKKTLLDKTLTPRPTTASTSCLFSAHVFLIEILQNLLPLV